MKYPTLLLFFLALCLNIYCQNWQPLTRNDIFHFKHKDSLFITQSVWVKNFTTTNQGDTTFILNETAHHFVDSSYFTGSSSHLCAEGVAYHLPHFLQKEAIKQADSIWRFQSPNVTYYFKPYAHLNDSWLFDINSNITATVIAISTTQIVGQIDSLKKILLSTGDSIFLSKSYGLLRFPTFDSTLYVEWAGIQNRNIGEKVLQFREIFDFEVGDVFYYAAHIQKHYSQDYRKLKTTITSKIDGIDTLYYGYHWEMQRFFIGALSFLSGDTSVYFYNGTDVVYNAFPREYTGGWAGYGVIDWDSTWNCSIKNYPHGYIAGLGSWSQDTAWGGSCFEWLVMSHLKYGEGIGLIGSGKLDWGAGTDPQNYESDTTLVGYIKNGISYGTIYPDWLFTSVSSPQNALFSLSPNPVKDQLCISLSKGNNFNIRIWDMQGREKLAINSPNNSMVVNISDWAKGLYFVEVRDEKGNLYVEKFVKE